MADLSQIPTEELMRMRVSPDAPSGGTDLSKVSTEDLMKMRAAPVSRETSGKPGVVEDIAKSLPGILPRAAAALVGIPETLGALVEAGGRKLGLTPARSFRDLPDILKPGEMVTKGYDAISEAVTGSPLHRPQTGAGRVVDTVAQAAVSPGGALAARSVASGAGALTGEGARMAGITNPLALGVLQLLGATAGSLPFILRSVPAGSINQAIAGVSEADLTKAQALMDSAKASGTPLTGAEAIAQVTGKNTLQDIQRVVEGSPKGGPVMQATMNARPGANRAAFEAQTDASVGKVPANPSGTPVRLQAAAEGAITEARQAGNRAADPLYRSAEQFQGGKGMNATEWDALLKQPAAEKALQSVRAATEYGVTTEPFGSVRWLDAAKRWIDAKLQKPDTPPAEKRIWQEGRDAIVQAADKASPDYAAARAVVAQNRRDVVNPMQQSPVGDIAASRGQFKDVPAESAMRAQSEILMPQAPRALDPMTIRKTVDTLNRQDPTAARDFAAQNIRAIFDETTQNLASGANPAGAAKFAAQIAGNPRQKDNLQALIEASGGGRQAWVGFNRLLEVFEAQGKRLAPGSPTAQNLRLEGQLSGGGAGTVAAQAASPGRAMSFIADAYDNFRFGKNTEEMARILTDSKSVDLMRQLAKEAPTSAKAAMLTAQIISGQAPLNAADASNTNR